MFFLFRGTSREQVVSCGETNRLNRQEDIAAPYRITLAEYFRRLFRRLFHAAPRSEEFTRIRLRTDPRQLRALNKALNNAEVPLLGVAPPGSIVPGAAAAPVAFGGARLGAALYDHQVAALYLGHNGGEGRVYERVERRVADQIVGDVDLEAFVLGNGWGEGVEDVGEGREGALAEFAAYVVLNICIVLW